MSRKPSAIGESLKAKASIEERMAQRLPKLQDVREIERRAVNPMIPDNPFEWRNSGLPQRFEYAPVEVPNPNSPLYASQLSRVQAYLDGGWNFLAADLVSKTGEDGLAFLPNHVEIDGRVVVANCYVMYADRDWYASKRALNVEKSNAKLEKSQNNRDDSLPSLAGGRQVREVTSKREDITLELLDKEEGAEVEEE